MNNIRTVVVACRTIKEELERAINETHCDYPILWIESGLHLNTGELRECIQKKLDSISNVDQVLLSFGYCGNAVIGLKSLDYKVIFPRVDDCITLLLGSSERRKNISKEKETYFLTKGWLNSERNIWAEYKDTIKRFGKAKADKIYKIMLGNYERLGVIETETCKSEDFMKITHQIAADLKLKQEVIPGTIRYIKKLLTGPWDDEFVIINPYETVSMEHIYGRFEVQKNNLNSSSNEKDGVIK